MRRHVQCTYAMGLSGSKMLPEFLNEYSLSSTCFNGLRGKAFPHKSLTLWYRLTNRYRFRGKVKDNVSLWWLGSHLINESARAQLIKYTVCLWHKRSLLHPLVYESVGLNLIHSFDWRNALELGSINLFENNVGSLPATIAVAPRAAHTWYRMQRCVVHRDIKLA